MKITTFQEIDAALNKIDARATAALKDGFTVTVDIKVNTITDKQFRAMHKWFSMCADYLNSLGMYRYTPVTGRRMAWTLEDFKDLIYKPVLKSLTNKNSTKDQNTAEPNDIRLAIAGHLATAYDKNINLPDWPSLRP